MKITLALLQGFAPNGDDDILQAIVDAAPTVLPKFGITTALRMRHLFAQMAVESSGFTEREENLHYSAKRLCQVWPSRFRSIAAAAPYAANPRALANKVYGGRMGNRAGTDDGFNYRGRGGPDLTGRGGYRGVGPIIGLPLEENPDLAAADENFLLVAAGFWTWKSLNDIANGGDDDDTVEDVSVKLNGGKEGLADRKIWFKRTAAVFTEDLDEAAAPPVALVAETPTAPAGPAKADVMAVQSQLKTLGYNPGSVDPKTGQFDGAPGTLTVAALCAFKHDWQAASHDIYVDATIDEATKAALAQAESEGWTRPLDPTRTEGMPTNSRTIDSAQKGVIGAASLIGTTTVAAVQNAPPVPAANVADQLDTWGTIVLKFKGLFEPLIAGFAHNPLMLAGVALGLFVGWHFVKVHFFRVEDHRNADSI